MTGRVQSEVGPAVAASSLALLALPALLALLALPAPAVAAAEEAPAQPGLRKLGAAGLTDAEGRPRRFALAIGVEGFEDPRFGALRYPAADAAAFGAALADYDEVRVLTGPAETTRAAILEELASLAARARDPRDTVVLYVSSHGSLGRKPGRSLARYLVVRDTRLDLLSDTGLAVDDLLAAVDRIPSRRKAVVLATCHSGKGKSQLTDELEKALARTKAAPPPLEAVSEAVVVITAAAFGEAARESEELGHDIYTHFLLQGLDQGDRDGDGAVTVSEAHDWARERTYAFTHGTQRPTAESDILGKDPIVLRGTPARQGRPVFYSYAAAAEGLTVVVDGATKGTLPGGVAVEPGEHVLELRAGARGELVYRGTIEVAPGERTELARLIPEPAQLGVVAHGGGFALLSGELRGAYLPPGLSWGGRVLARQLVPHVLLEARYERYAATGEQTALGRPLPFELDVQRVELGGAYLVPLAEGVWLTPGAAAGMLWAERRLATDGFSSDQALRGATGALRLGLEVKRLPIATIGARVDAGVLAADLGGDPGPHPWGAAALELGVVR